MSDLRDAVEQQLLRGEKIKAFVESMFVHYEEVGFTGPPVDERRLSKSRGAVALTDRRLVAVSKRRDGRLWWIHCRWVYGVVEFPGRTNDYETWQFMAILQASGGIAIVLESDQMRQEIRDFAVRALTELGGPMCEEETLAVVEGRRTRPEEAAEDEYERRREEEKRKERERLDLL